MCGIAGIWNFDGKPVAEADIIRFTDSIKHRGPDGRGIWLNAEHNLALGHRRLAILDLSAEADQPMHFGDNRYHMVFNGEIFNFIEIRNELLAKGYRFRTEGDSEVILAAYHEWKENMLLKFNGMWALCIYDEQEKNCFIARDRFGIKPFLYRLTSEQFAFASELKAFKSLAGYQATIDTDCAVQFLKTGFGTESSSRTLLHQVHKLKAGHFGIVKNGTVTIRRWWNTLDHLVAVPDSIEQQAEQFRELFYDSVKLRMRSDVSIGSSLSGGFDSSAVVSAIAGIGNEHSDARMANDWQQTFVATFPGKSNDERPQAEEVIRYNGVKGHFFEVHEQDALNHLNQVLTDFDDVYVGIPVAPWLIYKELRKKNIVVSLDGHGADELLGAYLHADGAFMSSAPSWVGGVEQNKQLLNEWATYSGQQTESSAINWMKKTMPQQLLYHPDFEPYRNTLQQFKAWKDPLHPSYWQHFIDTDAYQFAAPIDPLMDELPMEMDELNRKLYRMFHGDVLPTILRNFDRMSMAHGIEIRMPFMDWRLVTYSFSLPGSSKVQNGYTKFIAREAMKGRMPESIRSSRVKIGFNAPMPEWFNGPVFPWLMDQVTHASNLVDTAALKATAEQRFKNQSWDWSSAGNFWKYAHYLWFEHYYLKT